MGRGSELVFWLYWGVVIPFRLIMIIVGGDCMVVSSTVMTGCV